MGYAHHVGPLRQAQDRRSPAYRTLFHYFPPMPDDKLQTLRPIVFIGAQAVHGMDVFGQWFVVSEQYCLDQFTLRA